MSFIRPELAAQFKPWREAAIAVVIVGLGLWIALSQRVVLPAFGWVLVAIGVALLPIAIRRARFRSDGEGPGVVKVSEGRITYMGPEWGGLVSLDELTSLGLRRDARGAMWRLKDPAAILEIPVDALGADVLFDAFTQLPGLSSTRLLSALNATDHGTRTIWRRAPSDGPIRLTPPGPQSTP